MEFWRFISTDTASCTGKELLTQNSSLKQLRNPARYIVLRWNTAEHYSVFNFPSSCTSDNYIKRESNLRGENSTCSVLNDDTDRIPSWSGVLNEKGLILPLVKMEGRQAAQPALQHQLPEWAEPEARKLYVGREVKQYWKRNMLKAVLSIGPPFFTATVKKSSVQERYSWG